VLIEANDHHQYVVKWLHNALSITAVCMEALRNSVYQLLGLPVSSWTTIEIRDQLIDMFPEAWPISGAAPFCLRPAAGVHFASQAVRDLPLCSYEVLSAGVYDKVQNRSDFWGAYVLDVWTERFDSRNAIFVPCDDSADLNVIFIGHGNSTGSATLDAQEMFVSCLYSDRQIYRRDEMMEVCYRWIAQIQRFGRTALRTALETMPTDWRTACVETMAERLVARLDDLTELVFPTMPRVRLEVARHGPLAMDLRLRTAQII